MNKPNNPSINDRQAKFVREYVIDHNGKQAAIRAGYSSRSAEVTASKLLSIAKVRAAVDAALMVIAKKTETEAEWVRRRLKEEADDFSKLSSHSGRIRALELVGKINGVFELDNAQKSEVDGFAREKLKEMRERLSAKH